ncbi:MAG: hypothetical protein EPN88_05085 [Bacteroidetes bacterium]|nr:MAG: hypothetical protein EPN88_05085 [Bacteroidota bacterium]
MKSHLTILLLTFVFQYSIGQDIINTKDKLKLTVRIIEQTNKLVKYKMIDYEDGPTISIKSNRIYNIEYKNGFVEQFGNQNPRKYKPFGINAGMALNPSGNGGMLSSTLDYFIIPQIDLEINVGSSDITNGMYISAGSRFHINSNKSENKFTPFTGLLLGSNYGDGFCQVPVGINWLSNSGFNTSLSFNEMIGFKLWFTTFIEIRTGWRFKL